MNGLHYSVSSTFVRFILAKCRSVLRLILQPLRPKAVVIDPENPLDRSLSEKGGFRRRARTPEIETQSTRQRNDHSALLFVLNLCIMFAAFAHFLTLLTFGRGWDTGCSTWLIFTLRVYLLTRALM